MWAKIWENKEYIPVVRVKRASLREGLKQEFTQTLGRHEDIEKQPTIVHVIKTRFENVCIYYM